MEKIKSLLFFAVKVLIATALLNAIFELFGLSIVQSAVARPVSFIKSLIGGGGSNA